MESNGDGVSHGYSYSQMTEIWAAANATRSNAMIQWWTPEALYQTFHNTEVAFQRVSLPAPTQDCNARIDMKDRCDASLPDSLRLGAADGICDEPPYSLQRIIAKSFKDAVEDPSVPAETRSPAYEALKNIQLT